MTIFTINANEGLRNLLLVELHAVPVMSQGDHLPLPVFQEADGPEGHENAEEDRSRVVKQVSQLQRPRGYFQSQIGTHFII